MRTTVIYSPHQDDETLRLSAYVTICRARGDRLILVAVSDGGGTSLVKTWGWEKSQMEQHRTIEQTYAWRAAAGPGAQIIRMGLEDGNIAARAGEITALATQLQAQYGPDVEHYIAAKDDDIHPDHRAVVAAVRASNAPVIRVSFEPGTVGGTKYTPADAPACAKAYNAYHTIGWASVPTLFDELKKSGFCCYIGR